MLRDREWVGGRRLLGRSRFGAGVLFLALLRLGRARVRSMIFLSMWKVGMRLLRRGWQIYSSFNISYEI